MFQPMGLGETIFKERYSHDGESWASASARVARHVAAAEGDFGITKRPGAAVAKWSERFEEELVENRFCPGGRIWYGAGRPKSQLLNCWSRYSPVVTERGMIPISEVEIGDRVLTEDGTFQRVINKFEQGLAETLLSVKID